MSNDCTPFPPSVPNPPNTWSRVRLVCPTPLYGISAEEAALLYKEYVLENVNQNKNKLTKNQIYSLAVNKSWKHRRRTYATQTGTTNVTNPNTLNLVRVNFDLLNINTGQTFPVNPDISLNQQITCPKIVPIPIPPGLPATIGNRIPKPFVPPPPNPGTSSISSIPYINPPAPPPKDIIIPNGGSLLCSPNRQNLCGM